MNWCWLPITPLFLQDAGAGLLAAAMIAVVPGYISRSVAGSYDNEGKSLSAEEDVFTSLSSGASWSTLESGFKSVL